MGEDVVLPVEGHHLLVHFAAFRIRGLHPLVLLLDPLHLRADLLHPPDGDVAVVLQRREQEADQDGHQHDRPPVVPHHVIRPEQSLPDRNHQEPQPGAEFHDVHSEVR